VAGPFQSTLNQVNLVGYFTVLTGNDRYNPFYQILINNYNNRKTLQEDSNLLLKNMDA